MTIVTIPQILETELLTITPAIDSIFSNGEYQPVEGIPYQQIDFLFTRPDNAIISRGYLQRGYMQVTLRYPLMTGAGAARARAQLIRDKFKSGAIFSGVKIDRTPSIGTESSEGDRFIIPVFVNFMEHNSEA